MKIILPTPIVVTGAAGFIGSYIVKRLLKSGVLAPQIVAVDELDFFSQRSCCHGFAEAGVTLRAPKAWLEEFHMAGLVFHMGACSSTEETRKAYLDEVNVAYSKRVWEICSQRGIPLIYASSAATYGAGENGFSDDPSKVSALRPLNLYGASKQEFDLFVLGAKAAPPFWAGFKFFNVYGPGEDHKGRQASVALHASRQLRETGEAKLYKSHRAGVADGDQKRDFVFVGDVVRVMFDFAGGARRSGIYNLGTGHARSFADLARAVATAMKVTAKIRYIDMPEVLRAQYQYWTEADTTNLRAAGCREKFLSLEAGVTEYLREMENE